MCHGYIDTGQHIVETQGKKVTCVCPQGVYRTVGDKYRLTSHSITEKCEVEENFPSDGQPREWLCCGLRDRRKGVCGRDRTCLRVEHRSLESLDDKIPWLEEMGEGVRRHSHLLRDFLVGLRSDID